MVIGGGKIATRRVNTLLNFDFCIKIITKKASEDLENLAKSGEVFLEKREFIESDLNEVFMLLLCTDDANVNKKIAEISKKKGIFTSVCDNKSQCDFYFPAIHTTEDLIISMVGNGGDHKKVSGAMSDVRALFKED